MIEFTEHQIVAAARALSDNHSKVCNIDKEDNWKLYSESFIGEARIMASVLATTTSTEPAQAPDSARLDWLEAAMASNHKSTPYHDGEGFGLPYLVHGSPMGGGVGFRGCDSLREAIDAAREVETESVPRVVGNTCDKVGGSSPADAGGLTLGEIAELADRHDLRHTISSTNYRAETAFVRDVESMLAAKSAQSLAAPSASASPAAPFSDLSKHLREVATDPKADAISYLKHKMVLAADAIDSLAASPAAAVAAPSLQQPKTGSQP